MKFECIIECLTKWTFSELWLEWIKDEQNCMDEDSGADRERINRLFERAVEDYMCK